jgi:DNA-binding NtrC family response regulator
VASAVGAADAEEGGSGDLQGCFACVLLVEDNPIILRYMAGAFAGWGARVIQARSVEVAMTRLSMPLDLLIADVCLPDGTTRELLEQALRMPSHPVVIAISGRASPVEAFELAKAGVHAFLPKPFSKAELARCVRHALDKRS